jgi:hypothetical protein
LDSGLKAKLSTYLPFLFGHRLSDHILANNWANGWQTESGGRIIILYLPQYLEYLGYFLTGAGLIFVILNIVKSGKFAKKKS